MFTNVSVRVELPGTNLCPLSWAEKLLVPSEKLKLVAGDNNFDKYDVFHEGSQDWLATTPEPAVLPFMGISLLAFGWLGRRRDR